MRIIMRLFIILTLLLSSGEPFSPTSALANRREWLHQAVSSFSIPLAHTYLSRKSANAAETYQEEIQQNSYQNPNTPQAPEERSGLVVLRVAEVAQFQEKILRAILNGDLKDMTVTPQQIVFGNQILLRNSNLAGNMKLMIDTEIPRQRRQGAAIRAANTMNALQSISIAAAKVERDFAPSEMEEIADLYRLVRIELNDLFEQLPQSERDKYYGYFIAVTEYEKKIAEGVYNPDLDGVLKFDY